MAWLYPISNDGAALLALFASAFPLQFTAGTLESGPKALGEVTGLACSPGCPYLRNLEQKNILSPAFENISEGQGPCE